MSTLDDFREVGLSVNWRTVLMGWDGPGKNPPLVALDDVRKYAADQLAGSDSREDVVAIAVASDDEGEPVRMRLLALAQTESAASDQELRKWQLVLLARLLDKLPTDPLYGVLALTEFWEQFDFPATAPFVAPSPGDSGYYTEQNYERMISKHRAWLGEQLAECRQY